MTEVLTINYTIPIYIRVLTYARNYGIRYHELSINEDTSFFLCRELDEGYLSNIKGKYIIPQGYFIDEYEVEEFDHKFPKKEKEKI